MMKTMPIIEHVSLELKRFASIAYDQALAATLKIIDTAPSELNTLSACIIETLNNVCLVQHGFEKLGVDMKLSAPILGVKDIAMMTNSKNLCWQDIQLSKEYMEAFIADYQNNAAMFGQVKEDDAFENYSKRKTGALDPFLCQLLRQQDCPQKSDCMMIMSYIAGAKHKQYATSSKYSLDELCKAVLANPDQKESYEYMRHFVSEAKKFIPIIDLDAACKEIHSVVISAVFFQKAAMCKHSNAEEVGKILAERSYTKSLQGEFEGNSFASYLAAAAKGYAADTIENLPQLLWTMPAIKQAAVFEKCNVKRYVAERLDRDYKTFCR